MLGLVGLHGLDAGGPQSYGCGRRRTATLPAVIVDLGVLFAGERLSRLQTTAVGLAVTGLLLVQALRAAGGSTTLLGNALIAGAACSANDWPRLIGRCDLRLQQTLRALVLAMPLALLDVPNFDPRTVPIETWLPRTWYAPSAGVFCLWLWLAGLAAAAMPVAALATSALHLGERLGSARVARAGLVIGGIVLGALSPNAPCRR